MTTGTSSTAREPVRWSCSRTRRTWTAVAIPVGGGGQISGWALAIKATNPAVQVIGVEPAAADDAFRSFRTGTLQRLAGPANTTR